MCNPSLSTAMWEAETDKQLEAQEDSPLGIQRGGTRGPVSGHSPLKDPVPSRNRDFGLSLREKQQETTAIKYTVSLFPYPCSWTEALGRKEVNVCS